MSLVPHKHVVANTPCVKCFVVQQALQSGTSSGNLTSHLAALSTALTQLVMDHVSQALFNSDRLAFGMHLAYNLVPHLFQSVEWDLFLGNAVGTMLVCIVCACLCSA